MTSEQQKLKLMEKLQIVTDRLDDRFLDLRMSQLDAIDKALTALENLICTRSGSDRRSR